MRCINTWQTGQGYSLYAFTKDCFLIIENCLIVTPLQSQITYCHNKINISRDKTWSMGKGNGKPLQYQGVHMCSRERCCCFFCFWLKFKIPKNTPGKFKSRLFYSEKQGVKYFKKEIHHRQVNNSSKAHKKNANNLHIL